MPKEEKRNARLAQWFPRRRPTELPKMIEEKVNYELERKDAIWHLEQTDWEAWDGAVKIQDYTSARLRRNCYNSYAWKEMVMPTHWKCLKCPR